MYEKDTADVVDAGRASPRVDEKLDPVGEIVKGLFDRGAQKIDAIKAKVIEVKDQALLRGSDVLDQATEMIKTHPIRAVGIAFATGYLVMRLLRHRQAVAR
ncbi:MAG TPA: hypothetical protein VHN14_27460 [Kofleriaceae bacterium]|nr:hypothetical protein [Kofleriaceae bacterium]